MPPRLRGKWALGITPRNFTWILKDKLAICERPGGVGDSHRRVRRQEEIIWLRENGFGCVLSIIAAPHNLHNYDELQLPYRHRPFNSEHTDQYLKALYTEIRDLLRHGTKVLVHGDEVGDRILGIMGGYIRWAGLIEEPTQAIQVTERLAGRPLDPFAREIILRCARLALKFRRQRIGGDTRHALVSMNSSGNGSTATSPGLTSKCRWKFVSLDVPLLPTKPMMSPAFTVAPSTRP